MFKKASEIRKPIRALIYGEPGVGKTTILGTLPPPIAVIDFEGGAGVRLYGREDVYIAEVVTSEDLTTAIAELPKLQVKSIAFDGFSIWLQARLDEIVKTNPGKSGGIEFKHWNILFREAQRVILGMLRNPKAHIVFTCLEKQRKNEKGEMEYVYPDLPTAVRRYLRGLVDVEGRLWEFEGKKMLSFQSPAGKMEVKDRTGRLGPKEEPDFQKILQKIYQEVRR